MSEKVKIGIIGVGGRGEMAQNWDESGRAVIAAGADVDPHRLVKFRERYGSDVFVTSDYRALLGLDLDAIAITSPDYCHEEQAVAALRAGKHVFLEKPMAITTAGCDRILRAWRDSGRKLMIGFNMRHMRMFQTMKRVVDSGMIGEVRAVWVRHFVGMGSIFYYHDWHANRLCSNSLLLQKGSHDIDMVHWITGRYTRRVAAFGSLDFFGGDQPDNKLCSDCDRSRTCSEYVTAEDMWGRPPMCAYRREVDVEDNYVMIMDLEDGIKASYLECHFTADGQRNYVFIGTEGQVENSELEEKVWVKIRERRGRLKQTTSDITYDLKGAETQGHAVADKHICEDFLDMVLNDKDPVSTPEAGRMSVATACAATDSLRAGGMPVDVPEIDWLGVDEPVAGMSGLTR